MRNIIFIATFILSFTTVASAQDVTIPVNIERLAQKAVQTVNVTVDGALLQMAAKFLSSADPEQKMAKELISNLKGIYVRRFEFAGIGEFSDADVESLRTQLKAPLWSKIASVRSRQNGENVDVFFKTENDKIGGVVVIAAQARELTFVNIVGPIDVDQLARLGGQFGIPKVEVERKRK